MNIRSLQGLLKQAAGDEVRPFNEPSAITDINGKRGECWSLSKRERWDGVPVELDFDVEIKEPDDEYPNNVWSEERICLKQRQGGWQIFKSVHKDSGYYECTEDLWQPIATKDFNKNPFEFLTWLAWGIVITAILLILFAAYLLYGLLKAVMRYLQKKRNEQ